MKFIISLIILLFTTSLMSTPSHILKKAKKFKYKTRFSILGNAPLNARIHARVRASRSVTAASARGLKSENISSRTRIVRMEDQSHLNSILRDIEMIDISAEELAGFIYHINP